MTTLVHAEQNDDAHRASGSTYILTREDLAEAAAQSTAAQQIYGPLSVALNAVRITSSKTSSCPP